MKLLSMGKWSVMVNAGVVYWLGGMGLREGMGRSSRGGGELVGGGERLYKLAERNREVRLLF